MIQINLLPDVKLKYLRTQRNKRLVIGMSMIISMFFLAVTILLVLHVYVNQAFHASRLQNDIDDNVATFKQIDDLDTILTVRQQLLSLPALHNEKPAVTRLPDFLAEIVPNNIDLSELTLDFSGDEIRLTGRGDNVVAVNTFADVLKNTYYSTGDGSLPQKAFSNVEFEIGVSGDDGVSFDVRLTFDSQVFNVTAGNVELTVPSIVSTQSALRSGALFDAQQDEESQ